MDQIEIALQQHIKTYKLDFIGFIDNVNDCIAFIRTMIHQNVQLFNATPQRILTEYYLRKNYSQFTLDHIQDTAFIQAIHEMTEEILYKKKLEEPTNTLDEYFTHNKNNSVKTISYLLYDISTPEFQNYLNLLITPILNKNIIINTPEELYQCCSQKICDCNFPLQMEDLVQYIAKETKPYLAAIYHPLQKACFEYGMEWIKFKNIKNIKNILSVTDIEDLSSESIEALVISLRNKKENTLKKDFPQPQNLLSYTYKIMHNKLIKLYSLRVGHSQNNFLYDYQTHLENNDSLSAEELDTLLRNESNSRKQVADWQIKNAEVQNELICTQTPLTDIINKEFLQAISLLGPDADLLKIQHKFLDTPEEEILSVLFPAIFDDENLPLYKAITYNIDEETLKIIRMKKLDEIDYNEIVNELYPEITDEKERNTINAKIRQKQKRGWDTLKERIIFITKK